MARLGIALGVLGLCVGSYMAYLAGTKVLKQRRDANDEQLRLTEAAELVFAYAMNNINGEEAKILLRLKERYPDGVPRRILISEVATMVYDKAKDPSASNDNHRAVISALSREFPDGITEEILVRKFYRGTPGAQAELLLNPPALIDYLTPFVLPVIGFVVPWGLIRGLTWVISGFFRD